MSHPNNVVITAGELINHISDPEWIVVDCSFSLQQPEQGYKDYLIAHIPGAYYANLDSDLSSKPGPMTGRHPLPSYTQFQTLLSTWGYQPGMKVIAYDDAGGSMAASRLWWLLLYYGIPGGAVLDCGMESWIQNNYPTSNQTQNHHSIPSVSLTENLEMLVTTPQMREIIGHNVYRLLDGRAPNRYRGVDETIDPAAGHIPGAISAPVTAFLDENMHFRSKQEITEILQPLLGSTDPQHTVYYCGSGVTSALGILAMVYAGLPMGKLYAGSWSEWIRQSWAEFAVANSNS